MPKSLGGKGDGQNPEQLFAMGYAGEWRQRPFARVNSETDAHIACLLSAIQMVSSQLGKTAEARNAVVHTRVHLGKPKDMDGFGLEVEIQVEGVDQDLIDAGHAVGSSLSLKLIFLNCFLGVPIQSSSGTWRGGQRLEEGLVRSVTKIVR